MDEGTSRGSDANSNVLTRRSTSTTSPASELSRDAQPALRTHEVWRHPIEITYRSG